MSYINLVLCVFFFRLIITLIYSFYVLHNIYVIKYTKMLIIHNVNKSILFKKIQPCGFNHFKIIYKCTINILS